MAAPKPPINALMLGEDIVDKLKLLNYEEYFCKDRHLPPLGKLYFALPGKVQEQLPYFCALCSWLFKSAGLVYQEWNPYDDPTSICTTIIDNLKKLNIQNPDISVLNLRQAKPEAVCATLDFLLDRVLQQKRFRFSIPTYPVSDYAEEAAVDENAEINEETIIDETKPDDDYNSNDPYSIGSASTQQTALFNFDEEEAGEGIEPNAKEGKKTQKKVEKTILEPSIDASIWKLEIERVAPKLKFKVNTASKEWRTHLDQSLKHEKMLKDDFPNVATMLDKIGKELISHAERISAKERHINKEFDHLGAEFRDKQKKLDSIQEQYHEYSTSVSELTNDLSQKTDQVEKIQNEMLDRNNSMTDTSPLRNLQTALTQLKKDVEQMELRIGVVGQTLLHAKLKAIHHNHAKIAQQQKLRRASRNLTNEDD